MRWARRDGHKIELGFAFSYQRASEFLPLSFGCFKTCSLTLLLVFLASPVLPLWLLHPLCSCKHTVAGPSMAEMRAAATNCAWEVPSLAPLENP